MCKEFKETYGRKFEEERKKREDIFFDTYDRFTDDPALHRMAEETKLNALFYFEGYSAPYRDIKSTGKDITVVEDSTFSCAGKYAGQYKTAVLDFASSTTPGGGAKSGARAQEESLCRCSSLYFALEQERFREYYYSWNRKHREQHGSDRVIYVPQVTVIKNDDPFPSMLPENEFFRTDVIVCAAPDLGREYGITEEELLQIHLRRGKNILETAIANNVDVLILGAFGCGAFRNPPAVVASAYRTLLVDMGYGRYFKKTVFAIKQTHSDSGNLAAFKNVFERA